MTETECRACAFMKRTCSKCRQAHIDRARDRVVDGAIRLMTGDCQPDDCELELAVETYLDMTSRAA